MVTETKRNLVTYFLSADQMDCVLPDLSDDLLTENTVSRFSRKFFPRLIKINTYNVNSPTESLLRAELVSKPADLVFRFCLLGSGYGASFAGEDFFLFKHTGFKL